MSAEREAENMAILNGKTKADNAEFDAQQKWFEEGYRPGKQSSFDPDTE